MFLTTGDDWIKRSSLPGVLQMSVLFSSPPILFALIAYVYCFEASFGLTLLLLGDFGKITLVKAALA